MGKMKRINVKSSQIKSIGYDKDEKILEIEFKKGTVYQYSDIYHEVYMELITAKSVGSFFMRNINKKYEYKKVS